MNRPPCIEPLEARISPAVLLTPYQVSYTDENGESALVKISKPLFTSVSAAQNILQFTDPTTGTAIQAPFSSSNITTDSFLNEINLLGPNGTAFAAAGGLSISVTVPPTLGGVNTVGVGFIAAANFSTLSSVGSVTQNINLGNITIQGNLGGITAGGDFASPPAIASLNVQSMTTVAESDILGTITNFHDAGNFAGFMRIIGGQFGTINKLYIGGTLDGTASNASNPNVTPGLFLFTGAIGSATIGNIAGGSVADSGSLMGSTGFNSAIGTLHVTGNVTGGSATNTGEIFTNSFINKITIGGSLQGGTGGSDSNSSNGVVAGDTGFIQTAFLGSLTISGGITGGNQGTTTSGTSVISDPNQAASFSGAIQVVKANSISIGGGITGGSGTNSGFLGASNSLGKVVVTGNVTGGSAGTGTDASGSAGYSGAIKSPTISSLSISGNLTGGSQGTLPTSTTDSTPVADSGHTANTSGVIDVDHISALSIGGGIQGAGGFKSGAVFTDLFTISSFGAVTVGGDVTGGAGGSSGTIASGAIFGGSIQSLSIAGNLLGGAGTSSGEITTSTQLGTLKIGNNITGGTADTTGAVIVGTNLNSVTIGGILAASNAINSSSAITESGYLQAAHFGTVKVTGGIEAFANAGTGGIASSGAIRSSGNISSLIVDGPITGVSANPVVVSAAHSVSNVKNPKTDLAIGNVTINGNVSYLDLLAGYGTDTSTTSPANPIGAPLGAPLDGTAQIANVFVTGTVSASNIVAGVEPGASGYFGNADNKAIVGGDEIAGLQSKIASIVITGTATGDGTMTGSFGFEAEDPVLIKVNNVTVTPLVAGTPKLIAGNLYALEVATI